ncbi:MAG: hypothetical protein WAY93_02840 [Atopobiaceae bacterium]|jgi:hypothetical protein|nr:hypothetical protein [Atopobiaceae bacterium]
MPTPEDVARLERYEAFRRDVVAELVETEASLRSLKAEHKTKTATYQQLFANRFLLKGILDKLAEHGI